LIGSNRKTCPGVRERPGAALTAHVDRRPRRGTQLGYTLVELLVVAAIMGVLVVTASLAWRNDPVRTLESEAQRLAAQLELAHARTRIGGARIAISTVSNEYRFWQRGPQGIWHGVAQGDGLASRVLPAGIEIVAMQVAGIVKAQGERVTIVPEDDLPLAITLTGFGTRATVAAGSLDGRMDVRLARAHE
jgi:general secretion pathway protein H